MALGKQVGGVLESELDFEKKGDFVELVSSRGKWY